MISSFLLSNVDVALNAPPHGLIHIHKGLKDLAILYIHQYV